MSWRLIGRSQRLYRQDLLDTPCVRSLCAAGTEQGHDFLSWHVDSGGARVIGKRKVQGKRVWTAEAKRAARAQRRPAARKSLKRTAKGSAVHAGRFFLMKHPQTGQQAAFPLPRRINQGKAVEPEAHCWF